MFKLKINHCIGVAALCLAVTSCKIPKIAETAPHNTAPATYAGNQDSTNTATIRYREFFNDPYLLSLIDTALKNNQELNITLQEIEIARNEIRMRQQPLLPSVSVGGGIGLEKVGRYTSQGAGDATTEIKPGKEMPDPLADFRIAAMANWEVDIWKKLRNSKKAAITRYLATEEGKNFVVTNLVAEVAEAYYELLALDNQMEIVKQNIELQKNALEIIKVQKEAARATELAAQKFQAEVLKTQSLEFDLAQQIKETENRINFLLGRYPQDVARDKTDLLRLTASAVQAGIPSQLLANRADIKQAELELTAAKLDIKVARAEFYPSFGISAGVGFQAFNPTFLFRMPESLLYSIAGDIAGPLINRNAIKAEFYSANARQIQALYNYERTILNAYIEVANQLSNISNLEKSYGLKSQQVEALTRSIDISSDLFRNARADYLEVLMTQRDALEAKLELVETKKEQMSAMVQVYRGLGGGWR